MELFFCFVLGLVAALGLVALRRRFAEFPGQSPEDYSDAFPPFDIKKELNGKMICEGIIYGPLGRVTSSFKADFDITWEGDTGKMAESFEYNDGTTQQREWTIALGSNGRFKATAPDVIGTGQGKRAGSAVRMLYRIRLPEDAGAHVLDTVDWLYLTPSGTIINRSQFRKYGLKVAELVATIRRPEVERP